MKRFAQAALCVVAALALSVLPAQAQSQLTVNPDQAKRGKSLWLNKGCEGCHSIGKGKRSGPDLLGVTERRSLDWLRSFIKDPDSMLDSDSTAMALLEEHNNTRMPNLRLRDRDVEALVHYLAQRSQEVSGGDR